MAVMTFMLFVKSLVIFLYSSSKGWPSFKMAVVMRKILIWDRGGGWERCPPVLTLDNRSCLWAERNRYCHHSSYFWDNHEISLPRLIANTTCISAKRWCRGYFQHNKSLTFSDTPRTFEFWTAAVLYVSEATEWKHSNTCYKLNKNVPCSHTGHFTLKLLPNML